MAIIPIVERADEMAVIHHREQRARFRRRNFFKLDIDIAAAAHRHAQPVKAFSGRREHETPGEVQAATLTREFLDLVVQTDCIGLQLGNVRIAVDRVEPPGRMPGRPGCQFAPLE